MSRPVAHFRPSRRYLLFALVGVAGTIFSTWSALHWAPTWIAAALFGISTILVSVLALRPTIEVHESHLQIGKHVIFWSEIRRLDQTNLRAPLVIRLTLARGQRVLLVYPGDLDSCTSLLRHLRRYSREALLDGIPYRQFWGQQEQPTSRKQVSLPRYPLLSPEDEAEVEKMFQRLKAVGHIDQRGSDES